MVWEFPPFCTILIVDDDPIGRNLLEKLLHFQGYELEMACDGPEALTKE